MYEEALRNLKHAVDECDAHTFMTCLSANICMLSESEVDMLFMEITAYMFERWL